MARSTSGGKRVAQKPTRATAEEWARNHGRCHLLSIVPSDSTGTVRIDFVRADALLQRNRQPLHLIIVVTSASYSRFYRFYSVPFTRLSTILDRDLGPVQELTYDPKLEQLSSVTHVMDVQSYRNRTPSARRPE